MSTIHPTNDRHNDSFESMNPREQMQGMLILILILLLAIVLRSL